MMIEPTQSTFELTLARPVALAAAEHATFVHLWWRGAVHPTRLVQVYVNDELYDVTDDPRQHQMWLMLDRSQPHRIELLAVPREQAWVAQPAKLANWQPRVLDVARMRVMRDEAIPVEARVRVSTNGTMLDEAPLWPSDAHRGGFGALFGEGGFGFDAITGPGLGGGALGLGPLGADGTAWEWRRDDLEAGAHALTLEARDDTDQIRAEPMTLEATIDRLATPPRDLRLDEQFTLHWQ